MARDDWKLDLLTSATPWLVTFADRLSHRYHKTR